MTEQTTTEAERGLNFLKGKIVAKMKEQGKDVDINSREIHAKAIEVRATIEKNADEARKRLRAKGLLKPQAKIEQEIPERKILSYSTHAVWPFYPATIKWIQKERDRLVAENILIGLAGRQKGINATIILLSAVCIEGFLVECLESFVIGSRLATHDTYEKRLDFDFFKRVSVASFGDFPELFRIALGKQLSEIIQNEPLIKGIRILIDFRNGVGHARSPVYESYDKPYTNEQDFKMGNQYENIHNYLKEKKLIQGEENIFQNKVADHFAELVKPYMEAVIPLLPPIQSDNVIRFFKYAYHDNL